VRENSRTLSVQKAGSLLAHAVLRGVPMNSKPSRPFETDDTATLDADWRHGAMLNTPRAVTLALRSGGLVTDRAFDQHLPYDLRVVSREFWTPLHVILRIADWLRGFGIGSLTDIGAGAGKLCVASAIASDCRFYGVEHRPRLVAAARSLARTFGVDDRVTFIEGALGEGILPRTDAYYLFNPFGENLYGLDGHLDESVELGEERYARDIAAVESVLRAAPVGTYVITYNGFGGCIPREYDVLRADHTLPQDLYLARKMSEGSGYDARGCWFDDSPMSA